MTLPKRTMLITLVIASILIVYDQHVTLPPAELSALQARAADRCAAEGYELPPKPFSTDICTLWPNGIPGIGAWRHACIEHDVTYWCGGTSAERADADAQLARDVGGWMGVIMEAGVRTGGHPCLPTPWRWGYGRVWPEGCSHFE